MQRRFTPAATMPSPFSSPRRAGHKTERDLLFKGVLCAAIGLAVLIGPSFMAATAMREIVAQSSLVGWFALALGIAFIAQFFWQRRNGPRPPANGG